MNSTLIQELKKCICANVVSICYKKNNISYTKYYTNKKDYMNDKSIEGEEEESILLTYNIIDDCIEKINYSDIESYSYDVDENKFLSFVEDAKNRLNFLKKTLTSEDVELMNYITNYVHNVCYDSITIKNFDIFKIRLVYPNIGSQKILDLLNIHKKCDTKTIMLMLFFDFDNELDVYNPSNLNIIKSKYIEIIKNKIDFEKTAIDEEFNKLKSEYPDLDESESSSVKQFLDEIINNLSDLDNCTTIDSVISNWPDILTPNPFDVIND